MPRKSNRRTRALHKGADRSGGRVALRVLGVLLLVAVGVGAGYSGVALRRALAGGQLLDVQAVVVEGCDLVNIDEVRLFSGVELGAGLYGLDTESIERAVAEHPLIAHARVVRRPPHELRIHVVEQRPVAYAVLSNLYLVDAKGELFARAETLGGPALPVITGLRQGAGHDDEEAWRQDLRAALKVLAAYRRQGLDPKELSELHVDPALGVELVLTGVVGRVQLGKDRVPDKLRRLLQLHQHLSSQGQRASHVFMTDGPDPRRVVVRMQRAAIVIEETG